MQTRNKSGDAPLEQFLVFVGFVYQTSLDTVEKPEGLSRNVADFRLEVINEFSQPIVDRMAQPIVDFIDQGIFDCMTSNIDQSKSDKNR